MNLGSKGETDYVISLSFNYFRENEERRGQSDAYSLTQHPVPTRVLISATYLKYYHFNTGQKFQMYLYYVWVIGNVPAHLTHYPGILLFSFNQLQTYTGLNY